jgi:hypothetical protein
VRSRLLWPCPAKLPFLYILLLQAFLIIAFGVASKLNFDFCLTIRYCCCRRLAWLLCLAFPYCGNRINRQDDSRTATNVKVHSPRGLCWCIQLQCAAHSRVAVSIAHRRRKRCHRIGWQTNRPVLLIHHEVSLTVHYHHAGQSCLSLPTSMRILKEATHAHPNHHFSPQNQISQARIAACYIDKKSLLSSS